VCLYAVSSAENVHGFQLDPIMGICAGAVLPHPTAGGWSRAGGGGEVQVLGAVLGFIPSSPSTAG